MSDKVLGSATLEIQVDLTKFHAAMDEAEARLKKLAEQAAVLRSKAEGDAPQSR